MPDYLGPNQTRVLDSTNHNFESITYQVQKPPLSSEVNLTGKIDAERSQKIVQAQMPSGWLGVGQIRDDLMASQCQVGDVLCGVDNSSNALKFIAQDLGVNSEKNIAFVNGWRIVVQGSSSPNDTNSGYLPYTNTTEDNLIRLPAPPETESRIDLVFLEVWRKLLTPDDNIYQYGNVDHANPFTNDLIDPARGFETSLRIQVQYRLRVAEIDDLSIHPEGMDSPSVVVQGPLPYPISTCDHANFTQVPGDIGLWIAGTGDSVAQQTLGTVDGHTYAIPMFAIRRRNTQPFDHRQSQINGTDRTLADFLNGLASDRPDNLYNDWIVAGDFVDLRHRIGLEGSLQQLCAKTFRDLQANTLKTNMGINAVGGEQDGAVLVTADIVSFSTLYPHGRYMGKGDGHRRWFANATDGLSIPASNEGFSQVPTKFLEARKIDFLPNPMYPIAMKDQDIRVRYGTDSSAVNTLNFGPKNNMLRARGGIYKDEFNFGHQMEFHAVGNGSPVVYVKGNLSGYDIVGIADISLDGGASSASFASIQKGTDYTVNMTSSIPSGNDVRFILYTGDKFFDANKQGRGITDCYQMTTMFTDQTPTESLAQFTLTPIGSGTTIVAVGSHAGFGGSGVAYVNGTQETLLTTNHDFDGTNIYFTAPPAFDSNTIPVPVLLHTAIESNEGYAFFYEYTPYQGLLPTTAVPFVTGAIEAQGPAIVTTAGSGVVVNYMTNATGFYTGSNQVNGSGTDWSTSGLIQPGYLIRSSFDATTSYLIKEVVSDTLLLVNTPTDRSSITFESFTITGPDLPLYSYPNIIDRLPALMINNDASGISSGLADLELVDNATLELRLSSRTQDIVDVPANVIKIGPNTAERGRSTVNIPGALYGRGNLGLKYDPTTSTAPYKKIYQPYILNKDNSGRLYLVVVGSETENTNPTTCKLNAYVNSDSVDIFEIPGRPIITNRIH